MRNAIMYYYSLNPSYIHQKKEQFWFEIDGYKYVLFPVVLDSINLDKIYKLNYYLLNRNVFVHQIILNNEGKIIINVNGINYVLMKILIYNRKINVDDVYNLSSVIINNSNELLNWHELWSRKVDYFENQINELGKAYPIIRGSFGYYVGLSENAISLISGIKTIKNHLTHSRIKCGDTLYNLYNPLNLTIDSRVRDICEYYKNIFFTQDISDEDILMEIKRYFKHSRLTTDEYILFLARMLYPSYYFDCYEKILTKEKKEEDLLNIINKSSKYETFLKKLYMDLKSQMPFFEIEWLMVD